MKISFSSLNRYAPNVSRREDSDSYLHTEMFGFVERRFLKGLIIHKAIEIILERYGACNVSDLSINNQEMYDCGDKLVKNCLSEDDEMFHRTNNSVRKNLRMAKQMLLNNNHDFSILSVEKVYKMRVNSNLILTAKPDLVLVSGQEIRIIDWKTQSIANTRTDNEQLSIYKMVLEEHFPKFKISTFSAYLKLGSWAEEWHTENYKAELLEEIISVHRH